MSKSEWFTQATKRNALRRESGLPRLNIRDEMKLAQERSARKTYAEIYAYHRPIREQIAARIRVELNSRGFTCQSVGGKMMLEVKVEQEFTAFLRGLGVVPAIVDGTIYGSRRDTSAPTI